MQRLERFGHAERVIWVGFWINAFLMVMKLLAGYLGRSEAVFADGLESACDFVAILATMVALRIGKKPFDLTHPYGHGKAESIAAIVVSLVIFATGAGILYGSVHTIVDARYETPQGIAVVAALVTIIVKERLYRYSVKTGSSLQSPAILAVAKDHRKDAITSIATLIGVTGAFFGFKLMDPLAAGLTSFFIFHIGYATFRGAAHDLMDLGRYEQQLSYAYNHRRQGVLVTGRGCPYHCNWCAKPIYGQRYTARSPVDVAREFGWLKRTYRPGHIWIADDIFGLKPGWIERFAALIEEHDSAIPFKCLLRADQVTGVVARALRLAGCRTAWIGAESGSQRILDAMEKGTRVEQIVVTEPVTGSMAEIMHPTQLGGTRHLSAAQFAQDQPDSMALVASQDGRFTIFAWSPCEQMVHAHRIEALLR